MIGIILLAAGGSTRMGEPKQLLPYLGESLIRRAAKSAVQTGYQPILVVLGREAEACRKELMDLPVTILVNDRWKSGMGTSIRLGMNALEQGGQEVEGIILMLGDQPLVLAEHLLKLPAAWNQNREKNVVVAEYHSLGPPAFFAPSWFELLKGLPDDAGAKKLIDKHRDQVLQVSMPEAGYDIDSPDDYQFLLERAGLGED